MLRAARPLYLKERNRRNAESAHKKISFTNWISYSGPRTNNGNVNSRWCYAVRISIRNTYLWQESVTVSCSNTVASQPSFSPFHYWLYDTAATLSVTYHGATQKELRLNIAFFSSSHWFRRHSHSFGVATAPFFDLCSSKVIYLAKPFPHALKDAAGDLQTIYLANNFDWSRIPSGCYSPRQKLFGRAAAGHTRR